MVFNASFMHYIAHYTCNYISNEPGGKNTSFNRHRMMSTYWSIVYYMRLNCQYTRHHPALNTMPRPKRAASSGASAIFAAAGPRKRQSRANRPPTPTPSSPSSTASSSMEIASPTSTSASSPIAPAISSPVASRGPSVSSPVDADVVGRRAEEIEDVAQGNNRTGNTGGGRAEDDDADAVNETDAVNERALGINALPEGGDEEDGEAGQLVEEGGDPPMWSSSERFDIDKARKNEAGAPQDVLIRLAEAMMPDLNRQVRQCTKIRYENTVLDVC